MRLREQHRFAMEAVWFQVDLGHLHGGYFDAGVIGSLCQFCLDPEPCGGLGAGNRIDDGLIADQRSCPPVLRDEGIHAPTTLPAIGFESGFVRACLALTPGSCEGYSCGSGRSPCTGIPLMRP